MRENYIETCECMLASQATLWLSGSILPARRRCSRFRYSKANVVESEVLFLRYGKMFSPYKVVIYSDSTNHEYIKASIDGAMKGFFPGYSWAGVEKS